MTYSAVHEAVGHFDIEALQALIDQKVSLVEKNLEGIMPLHLAVGQNYLEAVKLLLEAGADASINVKDPEGLTPLQEAIEHDQDYDIVESLLHFGASIDVRDSKGQTPLQVAVRYHSDYDIVKLLLEAGASVDQEDLEGQTPLNLVSHYTRDEKTLRLLLDFGGASVNKKDRRGLTPLHLAAQWGDQDFLRVLIRHGGSESVNVKSKDHKTPLHLAAGTNPYTKPIELLIEYGAAVNGKDSKGELPCTWRWAGAT